MKNLVLLLLLPLLAFVATGCCDDEPQKIEASDICGTWYLTNIRGWEYDEHSKDGKSNFNESFNFDSAGNPVGANKEEAQKLRIDEVSNSTLGVTNFYWGFNEYVRDWEWFADETGTVTLQGNQLIDGTMRVTITKLSSTEMITYQKDEDGETYVTYTRLNVK